MRLALLLVACAAALAPLCTAFTCMQLKPAAQPLQRRNFVVISAAAAVLSAAATAGAAAPACATTSTSVVNSVLSGYGLPLLQDSPGFSTLVWRDDSSADKALISLSYPKAWVESTRGATTVGASDYQQGDSCRVVTKAVPSVSSIEAVSSDTIALATAPGDSQRSAPEYKLLKRKSIDR
jgi:hypothetical protein